jgi:hypothetical protein
MIFKNNTSLFQKLRRINKYYFYDEEQLAAPARFLSGPQFAKVPEMKK